MITSNIYYRVFRTCFGNTTGTCFAVEVDEKQYIVTAKHLLTPRQVPTSILLDQGGAFYQFPCTFVGYGKDDTDIAVLSLQQQIAPTFPAPATRAGMVYAQDVYFLGFPFNLRFDLEISASKFPFPLVKKAIVSGTEEGRYGVMYLDGHNNPGFSGGPVVFKPPGSNVFQIMGVVSGFRTEDVKALKGTDEKETDLIIRLNTGIIVSYPIDAAIDVIKENPVGFPVGT